MLKDDDLKEIHNQYIMVDILLKLSVLEDILIKKGITTREEIISEIDLAAVTMAKKVLEKTPELTNQLGDPKSIDDVLGMFGISPKDNKNSN